jgi:hypothetical protein
MAEIAALADIDIPAGQFERRIRPHALDLFDGGFDPEERSYLHQAANRDHKKDPDQQ